MRLEDLARASPYAGPLAVPEWTLGCFRRRCITYFDGAEDTSTHVIWLQSHGLTADIRIPARRVEVSAYASMADCPPQAVAELAKADGFIARTAWGEGLMSWETFATFQPYTRWPEPGRLERVGASLIEWAPSGAYVEDWRLQPGSDGLSVGLTLIDETDHEGRTYPRQGGLVIAGEHALQVVGRRRDLEPGRANEQLGEAGVPAVFDCSIFYGRGPAGAPVIELSIDPFAVGQPFPGLDAFGSGETADVLVQQGGSHDDWRQRRWRIDTLLADQARPMATPVAPAGREWLAHEWDVLAP